LGLAWNDLNGKKVLELGAGAALLAPEARNRRLDITFVDKHPEWTMGERGPPKGSAYLIADADAMPFPDETFDLVISHSGPPVTSANSKAEVFSTLCEVMRVLKPTGDIRIFPATLNAQVFEDDELWTAEESAYILGSKYTLSRIGRIADASLRFLQSVFPSVSQVVVDADASYPQNMCFSMRRLPADSEPRPIGP